MAETKIENQKARGMQGLFPKPVKLIDLPRDFTKSELDFFCSLEERGNTGNTTSKDSRVLDGVVLSEIKKFCTREVNAFCEEVYKNSSDVELYITQSWVNYNRPGQHHHEHSHSNSFISGVLYIHADEEFDRINFYNREHVWLKLDPTEYNVFNSESWFFPVGTGTLCLFPSNLKHAVPPNTQEYTRISLSFNSFLRGNMGSEDQLTHLSLP